MKKDYTSWMPLSDIPFHNLYFFELRSSINSLAIFLKVLGSNDKVLSIKFNGIIGYRVFDESARLNSYSGNSNISEFRISNTSDFLKWFREESLGIFDDRALIHYVICNTDNIIDVISGSHVEVEWINSL
jgi:hypothetical protein